MTFPPASAIRAAIKKLAECNVPADAYGNYHFPVHPATLSRWVYENFGFRGFRARRKSARLRMMAGFPVWYKP